MNGAASFRNGIGGTTRTPVADKHTLEVLEALGRTLLEIRQGEAYPGSCYVTAPVAYCAVLRAYYEDADVATLALVALAALPPSSSIDTAIHAADIAVAASLALRRHYGSINIALGASSLWRRLLPFHRCLIDAKVPESITLAVESVMMNSDSLSFVLHAGRSCTCHGCPRRGSRRPQRLTRTHA